MVNTEAQLTLAELNHFSLSQLSMQNGIAPKFTTFDVIQRIHDGLLVKKQNTNQERSAMYALMQLARPKFDLMSFFSEDSSYNMFGMPYKKGEPREKLPSGINVNNFRHRFENFLYVMAFSKLANTQVKPGCGRSGDYYKDHVGFLRDNELATRQTVQVQPGKWEHQVLLTPGANYLAQKVNNLGGVTPVTHELLQTGYVLNSYYQLAIDGENPEKRESTIADNFNERRGLGEELNWQDVTGLRLQANCLDSKTGKPLDDFSLMLAGIDRKAVPHCTNCPLLDRCGVVAANVANNNNSDLVNIVVNPTIAITLDACRDRLIK